MYFIECSLIKLQLSAVFQIFQGNTNVHKIVRRNLNPDIMARYIRIHPGYTVSTVCMRLELYGCVPVNGW